LQPTSPKRSIVPEMMEDPPPSSEVPAAVAAADSKPQLNGPSEQDTQELVV
jgi:hypothetical protein